MMFQHPSTAHALRLHAPRGAANLGPWPDEAAHADDGEGPGLLVSRAFWIGGVLSLALWAGVTLLALHWI